MPTEVLSLARIFNNRLFRIPDFQRGYAWGERQLTDFWSDLNRISSDRTHYCGQLTLEKVNEDSWRRWEGDEWLIDDADYEPYYVVDGQQRLTTSIILLQCLLEAVPGETLLAGQKATDHQERYLVKGNGVLRSCLFGYAKDNPSHEYFRTQILGVPSNDYHGVLTVYTSNLGYALDFFRSRIGELAEVEEKERLLKALVQRFRFNLHELSDDIDVFVAFETMNNRGKPLSRLELLKNRLIYLYTLAQDANPAKQKVRHNINAVWRTVYEELGRNPNEALDDDEFLRSHWIVFFGYDKDEADPLTRFLLNTHFTPERLDSGDLTLNEIQAYVDHLQVSARVWQRMHFPRNHQDVLGDKVTSALLRIGRLGFGVLKPLLLAALATEPREEEALRLLVQAERFLFLVRSLVKTRSDVAGPDSYRLSHDIYLGNEPVLAGEEMLASRVTRHFSVNAFQTAIDELFAEDNVCASQK